MNAVIVLEDLHVEQRAARIEPDGVVRFAWHHPQRHHALRSELYLARITRADARLGGVFVDLGDQEGFLPVKGRAAPVGASQLVEIRREPVGDKVAEVDARPVLRLPTINVPIGEAPRPGVMPITEEEAAPLIDAASRLGDGLRQEGAPGRVHPVPALVTLLTSLLDGEPFELVVDHVETLRMVKPFLPATHPVTVGLSPALAARLAEGQEKALSRVWPLAGGGRLVIDQTEALTAIDVDLGRQSGQSKEGAATRVLGAALAELGMAARLMDLGGQIVIDLPRAAIRAPKIVRDQLTRALKPLGRVNVPAVTADGLCVVIAPRPVPSVLERLTRQADAGVRPTLVLAEDVESAAQIRSALATANREGGPATLRPEGDVSRQFATGAPLREWLEARYGDRLRIQTS
jgi:hypothetical protein